MARQSSGSAILATIVTLVVILAAVNIITDGAVSDALFPESATSVPSAEGYVGSVTPAITHSNSLKTSTTYREGSHVVTTWYTCSGCSSAIPEANSNFAQGVTGNTSFTLSADDNGVVYAFIQNADNAGLYLDMDRTKSANGAIEVLAYKEVDGSTSNREEMVARIKVSGELQGGVTAFPLAFNAKWYPMGSVSGKGQEADSSGASTNACDGSTTIPVCERTVGTSKNSTEAVYRFTFAATDTAILLNELWVVYNNTDDSKWDLESVTITMYQPSTNGFTELVILDSQLQEIDETSNSTYRYYFADNLSEISSNLAASVTDGDAFFEVKIKTDLTLATNDRLVQHLKIRYLDDQEVQQYVMGEAIFYAGEDGD